MITISTELWLCCSLLEAEIDDCTVEPVEEISPMYPLVLRELSSATGKGRSAENSIRFSSVSSWKAVLPRLSGLRGCLLPTGHQRDTGHEFQLALLSAGDAQFGVGQGEPYAEGATARIE